jgi:uncharacterized protein (TIGR03067 family)
MRVTLALLAVFGVSAFAPAPFPRTDRQDRETEVSLRFLQGKWDVVSMETINEQGQRQRARWGVKGIVVQGDHWSYVYSLGGKNSTYGFNLNGSTRPASMDWYVDPFKRESEPYLFGVIRRKGSIVEILYYPAQGEKRVTSFENPPRYWWYLTLRRAD